ncbi:hypothetical protein HJC99_05410 [Candidatus Saccharibacteria bacterium]|nr:hypothetical protein [Candidatus Saccharibacteria bacterium]
MLTTYEQHGKTKILATLISVAVIGGTVITIDKIKSNQTSAVSTLSTVSTSASSLPTTTPATPSATGAASSTTNGYKDGTYSASANYRVPHSQESISVEVKLVGGVITNASIQNSEGDSTSASYQQDFASSYKNYVVGKSLSGLSLDVISGASDTTSGFVQTLNQIASQAQA